MLVYMFICFQPDVALREFIFFLRFEPCKITLEMLLHQDIFIEPMFVSLGGPFFRIHVAFS